ncbi:unnamed protein product [Caretta caretta]
MASRENETDSDTSDNSRGLTMSGFQTYRHLLLQTMPGSNSDKSTLTASSQGSSKTTEKRRADESEVFTRMSYLAIETNTNASSSSGSLPPQKSVLRTVFNIPCLLIMAFASLPRAFIKACISIKDLITLQNSKRFFKVLLLLVPIIYAGIYCVGSLSSRRLAEGLASQEMTEHHETELKSLWQSHTLLEEKIHEIEHIKEQMQHLHAEINGVMEGILHSVQETLEESDIPGENKDCGELTCTGHHTEPISTGDHAVPESPKSSSMDRTGGVEGNTEAGFGGEEDDDEEEQVLEMINVAFKKVYEDHIQMPDWAQKSIGSQGQVVIKLPEKVYPTAVTLQHISKAISPSGDVTSAPKDFAVCGLDEETGKEILLGTFMYDSGKETIQTFQLKSELSKFFVYIKFNVLSNWGNPEYTCVYRVRVHGKMTDKS